MWVVCGPPRSATTFMLEAIAVYTPLTVRWSMRLEWASRNACGLNEHFYEGHVARVYGPNDVIKVLCPDIAARMRPRRAILMVRDPQAVSASARKIGQLLSPQDATARCEAFRRLNWDLDAVHVSELDDLDRLFARLARAGWPVRASPRYDMSTRAVGR